MIKKVTLNRVQGANTEPIELEVDQIADVLVGRSEGRCIVVLNAGHPIEMLGTVDEVNQQIEDAVEQ